MYNDELLWKKDVSYRWTNRKYKSNNATRFLYNESYLGCSGKFTDIWIGVTYAIQK